MYLISKLLPGLLAGLALAAGCDSAPPREIPGTAGPAPLRRLSDSEYVNALHDLFPRHQLTLPELPAEVVVAGFENDAESQEPSDVRIARYETIANMYAAAVVADAGSLHAVVGCDFWETPSQTAACATTFIEVTGKRLFRRPLNEDEHNRFTTRFAAWQASTDFETAVRLSLSTMLQSPQFLYRIEPVPSGSTAGAVVRLDGYAMASRLASLLWESVPDDVLLAAASRDELKTSAQLRSQADRMLHDERAHRVFWSFHRQWLGLDRILTDEHLVRTPEIDVSWSAATQSSIWKESQLFVENVLMNGGTLDELLTSRRAWLDSETARIYGVARGEVDWSEVLLPEKERGGLLTRAAFLAGYSHRGGTSPPIRGNALRLRVLCQLTGSPPPNADLSMPVPELGEGPKTNRELFERRTSPAGCQVCHHTLNGFGFGFENYNAAGAFQSVDDGLPVDAKGEIHGTDVDRAFDGAIALSKALTASRDVHLCNTQQWMRYALGRAAVDSEKATVDALTDDFFANGGNVRQLLMEIVTMPSFVGRLVEEN